MKLKAVTSVIILSGKSLYKLCLIGEHGIKHPSSGAVDDLL